MVDFLKQADFDKYLPKFLNVTERAAISCWPLIGKGDSYKADEQAVETMRTCFNNLDVDARIVVGEGERDQAPRLYTGEQLGKSESSIKIDVAVDPLEGTALCAKGERGAIAVMALAARGDLFMAPDIYMRKLACGKLGRGHLDLRLSVTENILKLSKVLGKSPKDMHVGMLNRERHKPLQAEILKTQAQLHLVEDGDLTLALNTVLSDLDLLVGIGGCPEGVLSACGLRCLQGDFQGQLVYKNEEEQARASKQGVKDLHKVWTRDELVKSNCLFIATGVTEGDLVKGVEKTEKGFRTHSLILTQDSVRRVSSLH